MFGCFSSWMLVVIAEFIISIEISTFVLEGQIQNIWCGCKKLLVINLSLLPLLLNKNYTFLVTSQDSWPTETINRNEMDRNTIFHK